jgi:photosystem II stability/assembly factor-like uncharacterized protein
MPFELKYSQNPIFTYKCITGQVNSNNVVAVGDNALVISEDNGSTWTNIKLPSYLNNPLVSVTYGNGIYIAVSENVILRSVDGYIWTDVTPDIDFYRNIYDTIFDSASITFGNNIFVAVITNKILRSTDNTGLDWIDVTPAGNNMYNSVTYGDGVFIAISNIDIIDKLSFINNYKLKRSTDNGYTWTNITLNIPNIEYMNYITYGNGTFVIVGSYTNAGSNGLVIKSTDRGLKWTNVSPLNDDNYLQYVSWNSVSYADNCFIVAGSGGRIMKSIDTNMSSWINLSPDLIDSVQYNEWASVIYNNDSYIAVGNYGKIIKISDLSYIISITNSITNITDAIYSYWKDISPFGNKENYSNKINWSVAYGGDNNYVAVSNDGHILKSTDSGNTWVVKNQDEGYSNTSITYGNGTYVLIQKYEDVDNSEDYNTDIMVSYDGGEIWQDVDQLSAVNVYSVAYGNNCFIAVGSLTAGNSSYIENPNVNLQYAIFKTDAYGEDWKKIVLNEPINGYLNSVAYGGTNRFIAVGSNGTVLRSTDNGLSWNNITPNNIDKYTWNSITYGADNTFIVVGVDGAIMKTTNGGDTWTFIDSENWMNLYAVTYNGRDYIIVGNNSIILKSKNGGDDWIDISSINIDLVCVIYGGAEYITVGFDGTILKSTDGENWTNVSPPNINNKLNIDDVLWNSITYGGSNTYVGVGASSIFGPIMKSIDNGKTWINVSLKKETDTLGFYLDSVSYGGNGNYIALGTKITPTKITPNVDSNDGYILRSTNNGDDWTVITSTLLAETYLTSITYGGDDTYIAVGRIIIKTTDGGDTWIDITPDIDYDALHSITYGGDNTYIAGSSNGKIIKTTDGGNTWLDISPTLLAAWMSIAYSENNNTYIVVGNSSKYGGKIIISYDGGENWSDISPTIDVDWRSVSCNKDEYVVVGGSYVIISNKNNINWILLQGPNAPGYLGLFSVACGDEGFVAGGNYNAVLYSEYTSGIGSGLVKLTIKK